MRIKIFSLKLQEFFNAKERIFHLLHNNSQRVYIQWRSPTELSRMGHRAPKQYMKLGPYRYPQALHHHIRPVHKRSRRCLISIHKSNTGEVLNNMECRQRTKTIKKSVKAKKNKKAILVRVRSNSSTLFIYTHRLNDLFSSTTSRVNYRHQL